MDVLQHAREAQRIPVDDMRIFIFPDHDTKVVQPSAKSGSSCAVWKGHTMVCFSHPALGSAITAKDFVSKEDTMAYIKKMTEL